MGAALTRAPGLAVRLSGVCTQCSMGAVTALAGATGIRIWLRAKAFSWMTPGRMRAATISLLVAGVVGSSVGISGA